MKITIESTTRVVHLDGEPVGRIWEGTTEGGTAVVVLVTAVAVSVGAEHAELELELVACPPRAPSEHGETAFPSFGSHGARDRH